MTTRWKQDRKRKAAAFKRAFDGGALVYSNHEGPHPTFSQGAPQTEADQVVTALECASYVDTIKLQRVVLERCARLFKEALPRFNWAASALDANAITLLNEVPREVDGILKEPQ